MSHVEVQLWILSPECRTPVILCKDEKQEPFTSASNQCIAALGLQNLNEIVVSDPGEIQEILNSSGLGEYHWQKLSACGYHAIGVGTKGVRRSDVPVGNQQCPEVRLPIWASKGEVKKLLDLFNALLIRFAHVVLRRQDVPMVRRGGAALYATSSFKNKRLCQWHYLLDRGSMVNFNMSLVPKLSKHLVFEESFGWLHKTQWTALFTPVLWADVLVQMALGHTLLAEGMCHSAWGEVDASSIHKLGCFAKAFVYPLGGL